MAAGCCADQGLGTLDLLRRDGNIVASGQNLVEFGLLAVHGDVAVIGHAALGVKQLLDGGALFDGDADGGLAAHRVSEGDIDAGHSLPFIGGLVVTGYVPVSRGWLNV